ncbi:histidinol-phosphatase [bacterium]|nr:MAG: histidinol-phosphatase [bacterium]
MPENTVLKDLLEAASEAAYQAGKITLSYFQTAHIEVETKADDSPVTLADKKAEQFIRQFIQTRFPYHAMLGEEFGEIPGTSPYRWIIDPIDGTKSFIHGVPLYGTMIGIEDRRIEDAVAGVVYFPALNELYSAAKGLGAYCNGRRIQVSSVQKLKDAVVLVTDMTQAYDHPKAECYDAIQRGSKFVRTWGDCYGHMLVAAGRAEIMLDPKMHLWDVAALKPIIEEAGGKFFDWNGTNGLYIDDALACNAELEHEVVELLDIQNLSDF